MSSKSPTLTTNRAATQRAHESSPQRNYLLIYNALSFFLWTIVTLRMFLLLIILYPSGREHGIYEHLYSPLLACTQTLAIAEVVHAALGLVRANPSTTFMQVYSRLLVIWLVIAPFPEIIMKTKTWPKRIETIGDPIGKWAFVGCLAAWGPTEMIKYGFFVAQLGLGGAPAWLNWLRYNTFFVLYPIGISSEVTLMYLALKPAAKFNQLYWVFLVANILGYIPGSYIMYTHMMRQRRRVMKGKSKSR